MASSFLVGSGALARHVIQLILNAHFVSCTASLTWASYDVACNRCYGCTRGRGEHDDGQRGAAVGRGLHSSTAQLNFSRFCLPKPQQASTSRLILRSVCLYNLST